MARPAESAMQRIQVGLIGLLTVLLFVWVANLVLDRAALGAQVKPEHFALALPLTGKLGKDAARASLVRAGGKRPGEQRGDEWHCALHAGVSPGWYTLSMCPSGSRKSADRPPSGVSLTGTTISTPLAASDSTTS